MPRSKRGLLSQAICRSAHRSIARPPPCNLSFQGALDLTARQHCSATANGISRKAGAPDRFSASPCNYNGSSRHKLMRSLGSNSYDFIQGLVACRVSRLANWYLAARAAPSKPLIASNVSFQLAAVITAAASVHYLTARSSPFQQRLKAAAADRSRGLKGGSLSAGQEIGMFKEAHPIRHLRSPTIQMPAPSPTQFSR